MWHNISHPWCAFFVSLQHAFGFATIQEEDETQFTKERWLYMNAPRAEQPASPVDGQEKHSLEKVRADIQTKCAEIRMKRAEMAEMERQRVLCAAADACEETL